ncbi:MAG: sulfatase [Verrucomicrobiota bacterium]
MKFILLSIFFLVAVTFLRAERPNFVFLLGDDINCDNLGCYGGGVRCNTPHIDKLAADGVRFAKAYTSVAMCAPFRQELYSGRTPWRTKTFLNHSKSTADTKSLPHYLEPLGYRVALLGKGHIGPEQAYPFERLGNTDDNQVFLAKAKEFIKACLVEKKPFCLVIASHDAHAKFTNGDASAYDPSTLNIPPYWIDTPELRASLPGYLAEVTHFDALVGKVRRYLDESDLAKETVLFACTEQGSQFPFAKWTCFDNGLRTGLVAYAPGRIKRGHVSEELLWMCDIAPTIVEMAGGEFEATDFDGRSQLANLIGTPTRLHNYVFGAFSNKGIIDNRDRVYPIRSVRDGRYSLIYSPKSAEKTSNVTLTRALRLLEGDATVGKSRESKKIIEPTLSWVLAEGADHPLVRKLHHRPEFALYDLEKDQYELNDLSSSPEHQKTFNRLKGALFAFLEANGDADPVETETKATKKN